ncbi:MAG: TonB-dependent receptor [Ignavibacteriales bacterium]|jgi:hemoglobin/transferrin/lactoferrin receptor protein|nr:MAG: TonB-dependent receptor [Ignavibacteriales bacterium]
MKRFVIPFFLSALFTYNIAQVVTIIDKDTDHPLELVNISSESPKTFTVTNASGKADLSKFNRSEVIAFQMLGYKTERFTFSEIEELEFLIRLEATNISLDQIVVSATKWNQLNRENPTKVSMVTPKDLALQNPQTAADLLNISGEVFIQKSQQGGGSPMIRGFATNRLLIAVDGIRMNTAIFRSGNLQNVISLDPFSIERAEVMFGPGSILYGSDAIGGVMSFYTLNPQFSLNESIFIKGNSSVRHSTANNEFTGHIDINLGWKNFALITSITHTDYGDLKMGSVGPDEYLKPFYVKRINGEDKVFENDDPELQTPTGYSQINLMQKLRYKPNENWNLSYGFHYSITSNYDRYDRLIRTRNGLPRSAEWYYGPQKWMMNNLEITNQYNNSVYDDMTIRLAHQFFEESRIDRDFNDDIRRSRIEKVNAYSINFDFNKSLDQKHNLIYGLEFVYNDVASTGTDENILTRDILPGPSRYPQSNWSSYAAYLTYQFKMSQNLLLQAGARYNYFNINAEFDTTFYPFPFTKTELNNGALTGSIGLVYSPDKSWSIGLNLSSGFRSPNIDDVGKVFDSEPGSVVIPNPDLKAEYAYNAELGIAKVFNDFMKIDLTGYYTFLDDAMVRRNYSLNGLDSLIYSGELSQIQAIQNAASAYVWGIQTGVELKLPAGFGFSTRFNYQQGEEELDDGSKSPLRHAGPWFGSTHLTFSAQRLKMDLYAVYNGEVSYDNLAEEERGKTYLYTEDENGNPYSPSWYTLNLKMSYQFSDLLFISGGIENITDQRYRPYSSGLAAPGRNFILSLRAGF